MKEKTIIVVTIDPGIEENSGIFVGWVDSTESKVPAKFDAEYIRTQGVKDT